MILEFINAFKNAYKEVYAEKIKSKEEIKDIDFLMHEWYDRAQDIKLVEDILSKHWTYLPIEQRKDYVQKTYDLIHYGFDVIYHEDGSRTYQCGYDYGLTKIYKHIYDVVSNNYEDMKDFYRKKDYEKVHKTYNSCIDRVNELLNRYRIKDE